MKSRILLRGMSLLILLVSLIPVHYANAASATVPPVDMFQLPWDQGLAWYAIDGIDNGNKRPVSSSHNYKVGGAIDFAPRTNMKTGDDTSNSWVTAAAAGTVVQISSCHMKILHSEGWLTEYQFLGNIQVKLGDVVSRNQRLGIIADGVKYRYCSGYVEPNVPHLHFMLRPTIVGATFAGWLVNYSSFWNSTTFTRDGTTVGLFKPLLNAPGSASTPTPLPSTVTSVPTGITPTPSGPYVSTEVNPASIGIGGTSLATVRLNGVPASGYTSAEFTCSYDAGLVAVSNIAVAGLFGVDTAAAINDPQNGTFIVAVAGSNGNKATTSGAAFTFNAQALQAGESVIVCNARVNTGNNVLTQLPAIGAVLTVVGNTPTPTLAPTLVASPTPIIVVTTPTSPVDGWLTFTNSTFGYQFQYPPQGQIRSDSTAGDTIITNLPIVESGTNLAEKYLEVAAGANATECKSLFPTQDLGVTVTINGISFLKQTGMEGAAGSIYQWVAFSTLRNGVCVSMNFILHAISPGASSTPQPPFDYATETAIFDQIIGTYMWLASAPTATPIFTSTSDLSATPTATQTSTSSESPTPTFTSTPIVTITGTPMSATGLLVGQVFASKLVRIEAYDINNNLVGAAWVNTDGTFDFSAASGTNSVIASASGFLSAQRSVTITDGSTTTLPTITLLAGDIDGNNVIDQFDALTIGMSYNMTVPVAADLNSDGIINVLDLELLAQNYRKIGPIAWE